MDAGDAGGGSIELVRLIDKFGGAILSDLLRYYNVDIRDLLVPGSRLTPRACLELIRHLPEGSATVAELRGGPQFNGWDINTYLTAQLVDSVRENTWVLAAVNSPKKKPKRPEPLPRPTAVVKPKVNQFAALARAAYRKNGENK